MIKKLKKLWKNFINRFEFKFGLKQWATPVIAIDFELCDFCIYILCIGIEFDFSERYW